MIPISQSKYGRVHCQGPIMLKELLTTHWTTLKMCSNSSIDWLYVYVYSPIWFNNYCRKAHFPGDLHVHLHVSTILCFSTIKVLSTNIHCVFTECLKWGCSFIGSSALIYTYRTELTFKQVLKTLKMQVYPVDWMQYV